MAFKCPHCGVEMEDHPEGAIPEWLAERLEKTAPAVVDSWVAAASKAMREKLKSKVVMRRCPKCSLLQLFEILQGMTEK